VEGAPHEHEIVRFSLELGCKLEGVINEDAKALVGLEPEELACDVHDCAIDLHAID
jgi:hypothetical protein